MKNSMLVLALVIAPAVARAQAVDGQKRIGFVVEPHLSSALFTTGTMRNADGTTSATTLDGVGGGFLLGAKIARVIVGVGLDLQRVAIDQTSTTTNIQTGMTTKNTQSTSATSVVVAPGVRVSIVRSRDRRVDFFGQLDVGFGTTITGSSVSLPPNVSTSYFHFSFDVGPGLRYWVHPQFAVGAVTGVRCDFEFDSASGPSGMTNFTQSTSTSLTSIFAALQLTGVF